MLKLKYDLEKVEKLACVGARGAEACLLRQIRLEKK